MEWLDSAIAPHGLREWGRKGQRKNRSLAEREQTSHDSVERCPALRPLNGSDARPAIAVATMSQRAQGRTSTSSVGSNVGVERRP
jgi:hypothetical protein